MYKFVFLLFLSAFNGLYSAEAEVIEINETNSYRVPHYEEPKIQKQDERKVYWDLKHKPPYSFVIITNLITGERTERYNATSDPKLARGTLKEALKAAGIKAERFEERHKRRHYHRHHHHRKHKKEESLKSLAPIENKKNQDPNDLLYDDE